MGQPCRSPLLLRMKTQLSHFRSSLPDKVCQMVASLSKRCSRIYNSGCNSQWRAKKKLTALHEIFTNGSETEQVELQILSRVKSTTETYRLETPLVLSGIEAQDMLPKLRFMDFNTARCGSAVPGNQPVGLELPFATWNSCREPCMLEEAITRCEDSFSCKVPFEDPGVISTSLQQPSTDQMMTSPHLMSETSEAEDANLNQAECLQLQQRLLSNRPKGAGQR